MEKKNTKLLPVKLIISLAFMAAGVLMAIIRPFDGLGAEGHIMLGTMIAALSAWIFRPGGGTYTIGAVIILLGGSFAGIPTSDLAYGFSVAAFWLLVPAMFLGGALMNTGLGRRIVYALFLRLKLNYLGILIGWFAVGVLFALLTPSITVRVLILTPIAVSVADVCLLEKMSRGRSMILISSWSVSIFPGIAWLNGSLFGPVFTSFLPAGPMRDMATEQMWLRVMGVPWLLFSIVFLVFLYLVLKPERLTAVTKTQLRRMYDDLGPVSKEEKCCLISFVFLLVFLGLQTFLPITTNQVILASLSILLLLGVFSVKEISTGINWDIAVFFGMIMGFPHIFQITGISQWLSPVLASLLEPIAFSPLVFVLALFVICLLMRFLDVTQGWIITAVLSMATPMLYNDYGLNPLISTMVFICVSNVFFLRYQQPWIGLTESVCGEGGWNPIHMRAASFLYVILAAAMLAFSRFYWGLAGII